MAANWHRRKWKVEETNDAGEPTPDILYRTGGSNEFWLDPVAASGNRLGFTVGYEVGAMDVGWEDWVLIALGTQKFDPVNPPTADTERLEGVRPIDGVDRRLRLFIEVQADGTEKMHIKLGIPGGDGDDGVAQAYPT